jgi:hypothetical protein
LFRVKDRSSGLARHAKLIDLICILLLLAFSAFGYVKYQRIAGRLASVQERLSKIQSTSRASSSDVLQSESLQSIEGELAQAEAELSAIKGELGPLLALSPYLGWLPLVGGDLKATPHLLDLAMDCLGAGQLMCRGAQPAASLLAGRSPGTFLAEGFDERILAALVNEQATFLEAQARLDSAAAHRQEIDQATLSPGLRRLDQLDRYLPLLQAGVQMAILAPDVAPGLLGLASPKTYLVLAQNNHELRATGGFISAVGLLRVDKGRISTTGFHDSYLFDDPTRPYSPPPEALTRTMQAGVWVLRDANWSPDFPTTARVAREMYQLGQGVAVDGVIAMDLTAVEYIVGAVGPIQIEAYGEEVSQTDLVDKLKSYWAALPDQEEDWWSHRKDFMAALAEGVFSELKTELDNRQMMNLLLALWRSLEEKHLLIYVDDPDIEWLLAENNWDGAIRPVEGDYLLVVDTNVGYNKVDPQVERALDYQVIIGADGRAHGQVTVSYTNKSSVEVDRCLQEAKYQPSYDQMMEGCYWDYLRLYVPEGSQITWATEVPLPQGSLFSLALSRRPGRSEGTAKGRAGEVASEDSRPTVEPSEGGKAVFSQFFVVAPGQRQEISFQYDLLFGTFQEESDGRYQLLIQKQPGTLAVPVHLTVTIPAQARLIAAQPQPTRVQANVVEFKTILSTDRRFELVWR